MHKIQKKLLALAGHEDVGAYGLRKLGQKINVSHPQKVKWHLNKLINDGYLLRRGDGSIRPAPTRFSAKLAKVPILGMANCGEPLSFADNSRWGYLTLSPSLIKSKNTDKLFAVRASGDSMNQADIDGLPINDGDYVIVDSSVETPLSGQYVVSSVEGLANVKKYLRDEAAKTIVLASESSRPRPPIVIDSAQTDAYMIHGRVVSVVRAGT